MRITSLKVERFGVWENLDLPKLSPGLNVFYGPNEAGKTTLMQFIRTCLYGGGDEDRERYIQMALDGRGRRARGGVIPANDPRRGAFNASFVDSGTSKAPEEIRRFLEAGKKSESGVAPVDAKSAATNSSRFWIGGAATLATEFGDHRVERRYIRRDSSYLSAAERRAGFVATDGLVNWSGRFYSLPGQKIAESLVITGPDGARVGDYFVKSLTCNLDESTYNGVFAIGLDELQRLGALNETEAAQMLYRLSVGVDRGSFVQVFQQIVAERNDILDQKGKPSILGSLYAEREAARRRASEASTDLSEYARLLEERRALLEAISTLQERRGKAEKQKRERELALQVAPIWDERRARRAEIAEMGEVPAIERSSVDECDALVRAENETSAKIKELRDAYRAKKSERDAVPLDPALAELAPRVAILEEDLPRLTEIDKKVAELRKELEELNGKLLDEERRLRGAREGKIILTQSALDALNASIVDSQVEAERRDGKTPAEGVVPTLPNKLTESGIAFKEIEDFKVPARRIYRAAKRLKERRSELEQSQTRLNALVAKLEQGLTSRGQKNLTEAIERSGALLSALRRRVEIEKRVDEMSTYRKELERQNRALVENQAIVGAPLYALGAGVVVGGLLFGLSLFYDRVDLVAGLIGLLVMIGCIFYKTTVERRNRMRLEDNQRRLGLLTKQLEQARSEIGALDGKYPAPTNQPNATLESRLQRAKSELAFFESLAPVEAQWREASKQTRAKEALVVEAKDALKKSRKRWRVWLRAACLPDSLKPSQVRDLFARVEIADDLRAKIAADATEVEFLGRERQGILDRLDAAVALVPKIQFQDASPRAVISKLRELLDRHADALNKRAAILDEMNAIKRSCKKLLLERRRQARGTRDFLAGFGLRTRDELAAAAERRDLYCRRTSELDAVARRLTDAIGGFCPEEEIDALLDVPETRDGLPAEIEGLESRLQGIDAELKGKLELSGRLGQQADTIAAKKDAVRARFETAALDLRLARMAELWRSRAVAGQMMEDIRRAYEKERQPETLREASRYLKRLTDGLYVNIWTPLGEDALFVDASNGETLDVAALSRGTRELLFIAIRLALVVSFEKHGVQMPLIWDDVLVNFDYRRAAIAAKLLVEFARKGRQIFLFTCHEHICRLFLKLGEPVCVLPSSGDPKRRRFRVLLPLKKRLALGEAELSVDVSEPFESGPNFVESATLESESERFAVDGTDFEADVVADDSDKPERERYAVSRRDHDAASSENLLSIHSESNEAGEYGVNPNAKSDERVISAESDLAAALGEDEIMSGTSDDERVDSATEVDALKKTAAPSVDVTNASFTGSDASVSPYDAPARRDVTLDGESARLQALSEISPTFSAKGNADLSYEVSSELINPQEDGEKDLGADQVASHSNVDYEIVDETALESEDALDFDEWSKVFSERSSLDDETNSDDEKFSDYFESVSENDASSETDAADEDGDGDDEADE